MIPNFYYHDRMRDYDFGEQHPLRPIRLHRTVELLKAACPQLECIDPGLATEREIGLVHTEEYIEVVQRFSRSQPDETEMFCFGFSRGDTPPFTGMYEAALAYCGASVASARAVLNGAPVAFAIAGGLHHAKAGRANGFCVFNDCAIACELVRRAGKRVLYVDIDLHHGDGTEAIFDAVEEVGTYSVHESGRTLYPGTGFVQDVGSAGTAWNVPLVAGTTGDTWLWAVTETLPRVIEAHRPDVIVLQAGCDPHFNDPLGHLKVSVQEWLDAVTLVKSFGLPVVMTGGGGYELTNVPRMWGAAVLELSGLDVPNLVPDQLPAEWGMTTMLDPDLPQPRWSGKQEAEETILALARRF